MNEATRIMNAIARGGSGLEGIVLFGIMYLLLERDHLDASISQAVDDAGILVRFAPGPRALQLYQQ